MFGSITSWSNENIAERLTFSSFTSSPSEQFGVGEIIRPYAIVAFPGYKIPEGLDKRNKDALWLDEAPKERAVVVWDGYCPYALHEVIYECFGFKPGKISGMIGVVDVQTKKLVHDDREPRILAIRPRPRFIEGQREYQNHIADLVAWSCFFDRRGKNGEIFSKNGGFATVKIYDDIFTFVYPFTNKLHQSRDSSNFFFFYSEKEKYRQSKRSNLSLKMGPIGLFNDFETPVWLMSNAVRSEFNRIGPDIEDVEALGCVPDSLFMFSLGNHRDRITGQVIGREEEMMALAATSRLAIETEFAEKQMRNPVNNGISTVDGIPYKKGRVRVRDLMTVLIQRSSKFR